LISHPEGGHRLKVFENRVLRRIFERKRGEAIEEQRRLHNEELSDLYASPNTSRVTKYKIMKWVRHVHV